MDNTSVRGGGASALIPESTTREPKGIAQFCLGLGYSFDDTVNAIVERCNLDRLTAVRIVSDQANTQGGQ